MDWFENEVTAEMILGHDILTKIRFNVSNANPSVSVGFNKKNAEDMTGVIKKLMADNRSKSATFLSEFSIKRSLSNRQIFNR